MSGANKDLGIEPSYAENFLRTKFPELFPRMEEAASLELTREGEFISQPNSPNVSVATNFVISHFGFESVRTIAPEDAGRILVQSTQKRDSGRTLSTDTVDSYARSFVFQNNPEFVTYSAGRFLMGIFRGKLVSRLNPEGNYAATIFAGCISKGVFEREMNRR